MIRDWPPAWRFALVQEILKTLEPELAGARPRRDTLRQAMGLLATDQPAPTGAEIARWLDEHRTQRYGDEQ